ncbi:MAG: sensor histidine kinase N-terminal domain-containing protein [Comamonadaceae bacterium]|nr:sensor histidine kinase N-terminal domain-containing protein [Comamonadaceae bacterium]
MKSLRLRLVLGLSLTLCVLWGSVAAWQFTHMQRELRTMLDERLIASAKMVASIVHQFQPADGKLPTPAEQEALQSVIARDGVACEVSLVRSEVEVRPIARTGNGPDFSTLGGPGFGQITKGGKAWRTYVLEENGLRVATADRLDVREHLVQTVVRTLVLPFALALAGVLLLTWWISTRSLRPLRHLREELARRPPHDPTPVSAGRDTVELAPLVDSLNGLLARMDAAIAHERRWTMDAAHELRTPLTAIKTHVQVAQLVLDQAGPPAQAGDALRQAQEGIGHMHATLEQLLQLARLESASAQGSAEGAQGEAIVQAFALAVRQSRQRAAHEGRAVPSVAVQVLPAPDEGPAPWAQAALPLPPALLTGAVSNLLDNALRHHQGEGPVSATLQWVEGAAGAAVEIRVRDQGPGLSSAECAQAAQRFWRKTASGPGCGLGLTIVHRIAESVGGRLVLAPARPGLEARLLLPLQRTPHGLKG